MTLSSYSDVFSIDLACDPQEEIRPGDIVRMGENHYPHFEVLAVHGDKVWVRNVLNGADGLALRNRCRRIQARALIAAE